MDFQTSYVIRLRVAFIMVTIILLWAGVMYRLYVLQIKESEELTKKAQRQQSGFLKVQARRGRILDRNNNVLALSLKTKSVFCVPREIKNIWITAKSLSKHLNIEKNSLIRKLTRKSHFSWIKRKVTDEEYDIISNLKLPGVYFRDEVKRIYPKESLLSHLIGFVNIDNKGMMGVERTLDEVLSGNDGKAKILKDAKGREIVASREFQTVPVDGKDVILTVDEVVQMIVEDEILKSFEKEKSKSIAAIVLDVKTPDILAMANAPSFNINNVSKTPQKHMRNHSISDVYEPGSLFKVITGAVALKEKVTYLSEVIFCEQGAYRIAGLTLHDSHPFGNLTFAGVMANSSNIGTAKIAARLSNLKFYEYIKKLGFGSRSGVPLIGESRGFVKHPRKWSGYSHAAISMGHEILVTPLQMAAAFRTIATGGTYQKPRLIKEIKGKQEGVHVYKGKPVDIFEPKYTKRLTQALKLVVTKYGTAEKAMVDGYLVAGKTGTAQKVVDGKYSHSKYISSFMGFLPADNPRVVILIMVDEPSQKARYGGSVAGPPFAQIAKRLMSYYKEEKELDTEKQIKGLVEKYAA